MKKLLLLFSINLIIGFSVNAQIENVFQRLDIRNVTSSEVRNSLATVPSGQLLVLDESKGEQLFNLKGGFTMQIPLSKGSIEIELEPANILSSNFKVTTSNGNVAAVDLPHFYHGKIKGVPTSAVAFAITKDAIEGLITDDKINLTIGRIINTTEKLHVVYNTSDIPFPNFTCNNTVDEQIEESVSQSVVPQSNSTSDCKAVEVYFEATHQMYTDWGSDVQTVVNTITGNFNNVSLLFANAGANVVISELKVWDSEDPYNRPFEPNMDTFPFYLKSQGSQWPGDLAHLVSTGQQGGWGLFYQDSEPIFNGMRSRAAFSRCDKEEAPFAFSGGLFNAVINLPTTSYNVRLIAHELGHNFGLPHTHSCTWSDGTTTGPIDNCAPVEGSCAAGPTPTNGGTVMSYCRGSSPTRVNLANGFGPLPSAKIRAEVNAATCLSASRIKQPAVSIANPVICPGETVAITASGCSGVYNWYDVATGGTSLSTNTAYTTPPITENMSYYVSCTFDGCVSRRSKADVLILNGGLVNSDRLHCSTTNSGTLSLVNYAGSIIRWESSTDNFVSVTSIANTSTTLNYTNLAQTTKFRAVVQTEACQTNSEPATIDLAPNRLYVKANATGLNSGESWENAITDLQTALNTCPSVTEIWVAKGTYKPAVANGDRSLNFTVRDNLKLYGGFAGTEISLTDRDYSLLHTTNLTTLSGDLNGDDSADFANNSENSNTVVYLAESSTSTKLDGFTVTGGNNTTGSIPSGGGIYGFVSNATIANCIISSNSANNLGGGVYNLYGSLTFENCQFIENRSLQFGGAIFNASFIGTSITVGVINSTFINNTTPGGTGSILYNDVGTSSSGLHVNITYCSFTGNTGGGSITNNTSSTNIRINALNSIFFWNSGSQTIQDRSPVNATNCLFDQQTINYTGNNNLTSAILPFVSNTDLNLTCNSLAKNNGTSVGIPVTDLNGKPRPYANTQVDIGAYELQAGATPSNVEVSRTFICQADNVSLSASCISGTVTWHTQSVGGTPVGTGATFSQKPMADVTYYASCEDGICTAARAATQAVVVSLPPQTQTVTENLNADAVKLAGSSVTATNTILAPARVSFQAGRKIELNAGFEAQNGSTFEAKIGGCENSFVNGMVAYYPFNGNANDESGNGHDGIIDGATPTLDKFGVFGASGKALNFDGDDVVRIPNLYNETTQPLNNVTYSLWFKPNQNYGAADFFSLIIRSIDANYTEMIGKADFFGGAHNEFQFYMWNGNFVFNKATTSNFVANQWYHVVGTRDNTTTKVYINAAKEGEVTYTNPPIFYPDLYLGGHSTFNRWYFNGAMDDLRIYNRALSDAEIQTIYNAEKP